jgi:hypothetical protein
MGTGGGSEMTMETWARGWKKTCKTCGGLVKFIECIGETSGVEWLLYCAECDEELYEEDVEFIGPEDEEE